MHKTLMTLMGLSIGIVAVTLAGVNGFRLNLTNSAPVGIWKKTSEFQKGSYIIFCLPTSVPTTFKTALPDGQCPGGEAPLLKKIVAVENDVVTITEKQIAINDVPIPNTTTIQLRSSENSHFPIPRGIYQVREKELWVISNRHPLSLDSRYFGAISMDTIIGGATPILIFNKG